MAGRRGHARPGHRGRARRRAADRARPAQRARRSAPSAPSSPRPPARTPACGGPARCVVARDRDEAEALERLLAYRRELGLEVERLRPSQARRAEPALAPTVRLALDVPGDHSVDPRRLVAALAVAFERAGGTLRRARVAAVETDGDRVTGLRLADGEVVRAAQVVLAPGTGAHRLPEEARVPVRPVKGQVLRLRDPRGPGLVTRTIRGPDGYLVPRADGRYVLGATMEERGWDTAPTAGAVYELLRDMSEVVPGVLELEIEELRAGLRPGDARQPARDRPRARSTGSCGRPATTATASCSRRSPPTSSPARWPASRCRSGRRPPTRGASRGCRHEGPAQRHRGRAGRRRDRAGGDRRRSTCRPAGRGVAVAVDAEVVPRTQWETHKLDDGARVEILRAIQGG